MSKSTFTLRTGPIAISSIGVVKRNLGQFDHSAIHGPLILILSHQAKACGVLVRPELRLKIREGKCRVPDAMALSANAPPTPEIGTAPLLCLRSFHQMTGSTKSPNARQLSQQGRTGNMDHRKPRLFQP
jgi:hypothetical protein